MNYSIYNKLHYLNGSTWLIHVNIPNDQHLLTEKYTTWKIWNSFEGCQSCKDFYFLRYGIPGFRSEIWCRVFIICFSFNTINLKFFSWLMFKIIMILYKMKIFTNCSNSPLFTLNISMASFWRFLLWIINELSLSRSSSKVHWWSLYTILKARSCILFILWLSFLLWNIHINGQYENCERINTFIILHFLLMSM